MTARRPGSQEHVRHRSLTPSGRSPDNITQVSGDGTKNREQSPTEANPLDDPEEITAQLHERSAEIKRKEVRKAVQEFEDTGELSERDREILEEMADRIIARVITQPAATLEADSEYDQETLSPIERFFDLPD